MWEVECAAPDMPLLAGAYAAFVKNEQFWMNRRGGGKDGLFHYDGNSDDPKKRLLFGGWESGWDDSPRWDGGVVNVFPVDLNCYMVIFYRVMAKMAERLGLTDESENWRNKATALAGRIEKTFWCEERKCYLDYNYEKNYFVSAVTPVSFMPLFIGSASEKRAGAMAIIVILLPSKT